MRILISNKFYYPKGGDCIHAIGLEELLKSKGHEVAFFAMKTPLNLPAEYERHFPSEVDYSVRNLKNLSEQIRRPLGSPEVRKKFRKLLSEFRPDLLHVHNIHSQLSPVIVEEAYRRGIPVVWSLHDYKILCPRYDFRRDGRPCELCLHDRRNVIRYRCMKNSLPASVLAYAENIKWNARKLTGMTSHFICPSEFIRRKMIEGGIPAGKLTTINNFTDTEKYDSLNPGNGGYYCYVGRLSQEKGIESLLKAAIRLPEYRLRVIGTGPLAEHFARNYQAPHIEYMGHRSSDEVRTLLSGAAFSVMPSECYENNPLAVIESLCMGTPVLGARTGGIPELINEEVNGYSFESGNIDDLVRQINRFWETGRKKMKPDSIACDARKKFSAEVFYGALADIYSTVIKNYSLK